MGIGGQQNSVNISNLHCPIAAICSIGVNIGKAHTTFMGYEDIYLQPSLGAAVMVHSVQTNTTREDHSIDHIYVSYLIPSLLVLCMESWLTRRPLTKSGRRLTTMSPTALRSSCTERTVSTIPHHSVSVWCRHVIVTSLILSYRCSINPTNPTNGFTAESYSTCIKG